MTIKQKIIRGYAITLGIAIAGTLCGTLIGNSYQRQVFSEYQQTAEYQRKLNRLQLDILYNRPAKQLSPYLTDPIVFQQESDKFIQRVRGIEQFLIDCDRADCFATLEELKVVLDNYQVDVNIFRQKAITITREIESKIEGFSPEYMAEAKNSVIELAQSPEFVTFIEFPNRLYPFHDRLEARRQELEIELEDAEQLRNFIIAVSFIVSIAIALFFISYTSSSITSPLEKVTDFAEQILDSSDFNSSVAVESNDETNILANSINQLVSKVHNLLQELQDKTKDLEQALITVNQQQLHLVQSEKMSSLGELVAGVAHEINNPVSFIYGNISYLEEYFGIFVNILEVYDRHYPTPVAEVRESREESDLSFVQEDLPKILNSLKLGASRIRDIVLSLRNFSRMDQSEYKEVDIHEGIDSTLMILQHRLKAQSDRPAIAINKDYDNLPEVECYPGKLNQVFMNLLANAIDALDELYAKTECQIESCLQIDITTSAIDRQWVKIAIVDNAAGIPESVLERMFNPFFTTKPIGKGTGMGLAISHQIIHETHQGFLKCNSILGKGTEFIITIPIRHRTTND